MEALQRIQQLDKLTPTTSASNDQSDCEPLKLLVHNVSHSDLCVTIQPDSVIGINQDRELMARPRSSRYKHVCKEIISAIKKGAKYSGVTYKDKHNKPQHVGFLFNPPLRICSWSDFRLRDPNNKTVSQSLSVLIVRVFFPLISVILPKWIALHEEIGGVDKLSYDHQYDLGAEPNDGELYDNSSSNDDSNHSNNSSNDGQSDEKYDGIIEPESFNIAYKLFLVSGSGHPLKQQSVYYQEDSTQQLSHLLCRFMTDFYPQIAVTPFYSGQNIFHYLSNITFVHSQLRPAIDNERSKLAMFHGKKWKNYFNLSITLCDGTPARLAAIIEGLRSFEPDMLHMVRRKTLWTEYPNINKLWDQNDFEYLQFNQIETYPAIPINQIHDKYILSIIHQMREWKKSFLLNAVENTSSEMSHFWLRKTHQPVLAILAVQKPNESEPTYYRGVNVEVSMPTGSLCAERNAIGTALANDPSLRREHFKMIAVLFMQELEDKHSDSPDLSLNYAISAPSNIIKRKGSCFKEETDDVNPRGPCGSCMEWLGKIAQCNPSFKVITFSNRNIHEVIVRNLK